MTEKAAKRERPLSPHLSIYKPQITSVMSITHRLTGVFNLIGAYVFVAWLTAILMGEAAYQYIMGLLGSPFGLIVLFAWSASISYHLFNGIRHLCWDLVIGVNLPDARKSGIAVLIASALLTCLIWLLSIDLGGGANVVSF